MADQEQIENEDELEEMPTIIDVLMGYKHDSDKIIVIGKFIETILNYIEKLETANLNMNNYLEYLYGQMNNFMSSMNAATMSQQFQIMHNRVDDMENRFEKLVEIQMNMNKIQPQAITSDGTVTGQAEQRIVGEITGVRTKMADLEERISSFQSQLTQMQRTGISTTSKAPVAPSTGSTLDGYKGGPPPVAPAQRGRVVEENLLKPSSFGGGPPSGGGGGPGPAGGGGMSIRMAMMSEIRSRMNKRAGGEVPKSQGGGGGQGHAMPKIHQPRAAKSLGGGIVGKMNKLLDSKFQQQAPAGAGGVKIGDKTGAPKGPPRGPPGSPLKSPPKGKSQDNLLTNEPIGGPIDKKKDKGKDKKDKKKEKKDKGKGKKNKGKDKDASDIANRLASIDEALDGL